MKTFAASFAAAAVALLTVGCSGGASTDDASAPVVTKPAPAATPGGPAATATAPASAAELPPPPKIK